MARERREKEAEPFVLRRERAQTARAGFTLWHQYRDALGGLPLGPGFGDEWLRIGAVTCLIIAMVAPAGG